MALNVDLSSQSILITDDAGFGTRVAEAVAAGARVVAENRSADGVAGLAHEAFSPGDPARVPTSDKS